MRAGGLAKPSVVLCQHNDGEWVLRRTDRASQQAERQEAGMTQASGEPAARRRWQPQRRTPKLWEAALPVVVMIVVLVLGTVVASPAINPVVLLTVVAAFSGVLAWFLGLTFGDMLRGIRAKIDASMPALLILISIGLLIGTWIVSGTIPMLVYYGLEIINPGFIVPVAFIVTAFVSTVTGTSWGSAGTVGVALMGMASGVDASLPMVAGAVVGGAYFGDKMSPLSDTTNLAPVVAGSTLFEHIRHLLYTTIPAAIVSLIVYAIAGSHGHGSGAGGKAHAMMHELHSVFGWSPLLIVPALIVLAGAVLRKPPLPTIICSAIVAAILAGTVQGFSLADITDSAADGFEPSMVRSIGIDPDTLGAASKNLLERGGLSSMTETVLIGLAGFSFAGILTESGCLGVLMDRLTRRIRRTGGLIAATAASSIGTALATGTSYLTILLPGEALKGVYRERGLAAKNLSRTLEDSGTVFVPLVPWAEAGIYMQTTLGVSVVQYAPWAVLCYVGFVFAIIYGYTGFGIAKLDKDDVLEQSAA